VFSQELFHLETYISEAIKGVGRKMKKQIFGLMFLFVLLCNSLASASINQLIRECQKQDKNPLIVEVDGERYMIVELEKYIDPNKNLDVIPSNNSNRKVYTDLEFYPVSDENLVKKIGLIDKMRYIYESGIMVDVFETHRRCVQERTKIHIIHTKIPNLLRGIASKALALTICSYICPQRITLLQEFSIDLMSIENNSEFMSVAQEKLMFRLVEEVKYISIEKSELLSLLGDPASILELLITDDFQRSMEDLKYIADFSNDINEYEIAHDYAYRLLSGWELGGASSAAWDSLDEIDKINRSNYEKITDLFTDLVLDVGIDVGANIIGATSYAEKLVKFLSDVEKNIEPLRKYVERKSGSEKRLSDNLKRYHELGASGIYTLALASKVSSMPEIPDISVTWVDFYPKTINAGEPINVNFLLENESRVSIGSFECLLSLINDRGESINLTTYNINFIEELSKQNILMNIIIPNDIPEGLYFVSILADYLSVVDEPNKSNNRRTSMPPLPLLQVHHIPKADLTLFFTQNETFYYNTADKKFYCNFVAKNMGKVSSSDCIARVFLSKRQYGTDIYIGSKNIGEIIAGDEQKYSYENPIDFNINIDDYYASIYIDAFREIDESSEMNNIISSNIKTYYFGKPVHIDR
jgi:hypothetical protein